eukprot:6196948-Pleurochrysis_carterae.AAC.1
MPHKWGQETDQEEQKAGGKKGTRKKRIEKLAQYAERLKQNKCFFFEAIRRHIGDAEKHACKRKPGRYIGGEESRRRFVLANEGKRIAGGSNSNREERGNENGRDGEKYAGGAVTFI